MGPNPDKCNMLLVERVSSTGAHHMCRVAVCLCSVSLRGGRILLTVSAVADLFEFASYIR